MVAPGLLCGDEESAEGRRAASVGRVRQTGLDGRRGEEDHVTRTDEGVNTKETPTERQHFPDKKVEHGPGRARAEANYGRSRTDPPIALKIRKHVESTRR